MVEATISYLAAMPERPFFFLYDPPPGTPWRNTRGDRRPMPIRDARQLDPPPSLDREGFTLARHVTAVEDLYDEQARRGGRAGAPRPVRGHQRLEADPRSGRAGAARGVRRAHDPRRGLRSDRSPLSRSHRGDLLAPVEPDARLVLLLAHGGRRGAAPQVLRFGARPRPLPGAQRVRRSRP